MQELKNLVKKDFVENDKTLCFQTIPLSKIFILSVISFGIYNIILAYSWWKILKENFGHKLSPFWRALFCNLMNIVLFPVFEKYFKALNIPGKIFNGLLLGIGFLFITYIDERINLVSFKLSMKDGLPYSWDLTISIISLILSILAALILVYIQDKINKANELYFPDAPQNNWKVSNIIWAIILGFLFIIGFMPI